MGRRRVRITVRSWHEFVLNNRLERPFVEEMWIPVVT